MRPWKLCWFFADGGGVRHGGEGWCLRERIPTIACYGRGLSIASGAPDLPPTCHTALAFSASARFPRRQTCGLADLERAPRRVPGFWWVGYGRAGGTVVNPYPPSFTARRPTPTGPIPPHLSVRRYVTSHTSAVRSRVSACLRSLTHSPVACLFFRVPVCGMHCAAASQSRHLHACAAGHASHGAQMRGEGCALLHAEG
jgi:hypothetical protein